MFLNWVDGSRYLETFYHCKCFGYFQKLGNISLKLLVTLVGHHNVLYSGKLMAGLQIILAWKSFPGLIIGTPVTCNHKTFYCCN